MTKCSGYRAQVSKPVRRVSLIASLLCVCAAVVPGQAQTAMRVASVCTTPPTMLQLDSNPLLMEKVYPRTARKPDIPDKNGASELTQTSFPGGSATKPWAVENQRSGFEELEAGVMLRNHPLVEYGFRELEYSWTRQDPKTGGFPESTDEFHSVGVFLEDAERALLAFHESAAEFPEFAARYQAVLPHIHAAALWMLRPEVLSPGREHDEPFTHRRWISASVLGMAGQLTGDHSLNAAAIAFAKEGIALQQPDGRNPERGGFDVSYQMVDALQGARYYTTLNCKSEAALMEQIRVMMRKTCDWELQRQLPDGSIDVNGSTRMGKETNRDGSVKHINYKEVIEAMTFTSMITGDPKYLQAAKAMAGYLKW